MVAYFLRAQDEAAKFKCFSLLQVSREQNSSRWCRSQFGLSLHRDERQMVEIEILPHSIIDEITVPILSTNPITSCWIDHYIGYTITKVLPGNKNEVRKLKIKAACFFLFKNKLYRRSFYGPLLKCARQKKVKYILYILHEGHCGNHLGGRSFAHKALTQGKLLANNVEGCHCICFEVQSMP